MFRPPAGRSQLLGAVGAVDVVRVEHEALVGQAEAALLAVEAVLVPGEALVVHHVGAMTEPCSGTRGGRGRTRGGVGGRDTHGGGHTGHSTATTPTARSVGVDWVCSESERSLNFSFATGTRFTLFQNGFHCSRIITVSQCC